MQESQEGDAVPEHFSDEQLRSAVIGAAIEVHRVLGPGFIERIYENALAVELELRSIPFQRQLHVPVFFKGKRVGRHRMDLFIVQRLLVELKAATQIEPIAFSWVRSYLHALNLADGLILNFARPKLEIKRVYARLPGLPAFLPSC